MEFFCEILCHSPKILKKIFYSRDSIVFNVTHFCLLLESFVSSECSIVKSDFEEINRWYNNITRIHRVMVDGNKSTYTGPRSESDV